MVYSWMKSVSDEVMLRAVTSILPHSGYQIFCYPTSSTLSSQIYCIVSKEMCISSWYSENRLSLFPKCSDWSVVIGKSSLIFIVFLITNNTHLHSWTSLTRSKHIDGCALSLTLSNMGIRKVVTKRKFVFEKNFLNPIRTLWDFYVMCSTVFSTSWSCQTWEASSLTVLRSQKAWNGISPPLLKSDFC